MTDPLAILNSLPADQVAALAEALESRRVSLSSSASTLAGQVGGSASLVAEAFRRLRTDGFVDAQAATLLAVAHASRTAAADANPRVDLVISGPDVPGIPTAATDATVHSLFLEARQEIVVAGYAFHHAAEILEPLARRLQETPTLKVILHVDIRRDYQDTSSASSIVVRFAQDFWKHQWPWQPRPEVWYDPRAVAINREERACLHAKFIAIDGHTVLITSANFTEAAQQRNIEAGIILRSPPRTRQLIDYFRALRQKGLLAPLS
jgi:hypothetical protein